MSSIDNRIVQMEFDNKQFEAGIQTTLKSLEELQKGLDLKGATEGIKNIENAVSGFDVSGMSKAVDSIADHFTWIGRTIDHEIDRITDRAIAAGEQMVKSLSIDQVGVGWSKYEDKTRSVATIMNATGKSVDEVNQSLEKLNWFTDETSYNFTDMVNNVGKFTSVGVDLDDAVIAMQGIANAAALSGGGISEASRAMYNFSQAMGTGKLLLQDWKSIELANMATTDFKSSLIESGLAMGTLVKKGDEYVTTTKNGVGAIASFKDANEGFRDSLSAGWITTDVMMDTFKKYGSYGNEIYKITEEEGITAAEAMEKFSDSSMALGERAFRAAQEARTFTDAINATKDAVSTGWMQSFEIIFGNYEQAKVMWTDLANTLWDVFAGGAEARNDMLRETFDEAKSIVSTEVWEKIADDIPFTDTLRKSILDTAKAHGIAIDSASSEEQAFNKLLSDGVVTVDMFNEALNRTESSSASASSGFSDTANKMNELEEVARRVINGDFGDGEKRIKSLTEAGYDYQQVQDAVNKILSGQEIAFTQLSDEQSKQNGYTEEEINQLKELKKVSEETGTPLNDVLGEINKPSGRELMIESASNSFQALMKVIESVKEAWKDIFPPMTSDRLYRIIEKIRDFTESLIISDESAEKLKNGFKGIFSVLGLVVDMFKLAMRSVKVLWDAIKPFGDPIISIFGSLGEKLTSFRDLVKESGLFESISSGFSRTFSNLIEKINQIRYYIGLALDASGILDPIKSKWDQIKEWITSKGGIVGIVNVFFDAINKWITGLNALKIGTAIGNFINKVKDRFKDVSGLKDFIDKAFGGISDFFKNLGENSRESLSKGTKSIIDWARDFIKTIKDSFSGISTKAEDSLSKVGDSIGKGFKWISDVLTKGFNFLKEDVGPVVDLIRNVIFLKTLSRINKFIEDFSKMFGSFSSIIEGAADVVKSASTFLTDLGTGLKDVLKAKSKDFKANAILKVAAAIGILVAAVFVLTKLDPNQVYDALTVIGVLFAELAAGLWAFNKALGEGNAKGVKKISGFLGLALGIFVLVGVMQKLIKMDVKQIGLALGEIGAILVVLAGFSRLVSKDFKAYNGAALILTAISLQGFILAMLEIAHMDPGNVAKGLIGLGILLGEIGIFTKLASKEIKFSNGMTLLMVALSLQAFLLVMLEIAHMDPESAVKGIVGLGILLGEIGIFTELASNEIKFSNGMGLIGVATSMLIFAKTIKKIGSLNGKTLVKGLAGLGLAIFEISLLTKSMSKMNISSGIGSLLGMTSLLVLIPLFKSLSKIPDIDKIGVGLGVAIAGIGIGMKALSKIGGIGGALSASGALLTFAGTVAIIIGVMEVVAGLISKIEGAGEFLDGATEILTKVGEGIGGFLGGILGGIAYGTMSAVGKGLEDIGASLSIFWNNASTFVEGAKGLKAEDFAGIDALTGAVLKLTESEFLDALTSLIGGGEKNLATFAGQLFVLGPALAFFSLTSKFVDSKAVQNAADSLSAIANIQIPASGGFLQKIIGEEDFGKFGSQLETLGSNLATFADDTVGHDYSAIGPAADALAKLVSVDIPTVGGIVNAIVGRTDWGVFGNQLAEFGPGFATFAESVNGIQVKGLPDAANALQTLLSIDAPKNEWGIAQIFTGTTNWGTFGTQLTEFGKGFKGFASSMEGVTTESLSGVTPAVDAMKSLLELEVPKTEGFFQWLVGKKDLGDFGDNLGKIGTGFGTFNTNIGDVNIPNLESVVSMIERLGTFSQGISGTIVEDIENFSTAMGLLDFSDGTLDNAINSLSGLTDDFATTGEEFANALKDSFNENLSMSSSDVGDQINSIINAIKAYSMFFVSAGTALINAFISGMNSKSGSSKTAGGNSALNAVTGMRNKRASAVSAGQFIVEGFIAGMGSKLNDLITAAENLANAANQAFQNRLKISSPSKIMEQNGIFFIEGFVRSVQNGRKIVANASGGLADSALKSFLESMDLINDIINNSMDMQPRIRPVVDLSGVQYGAGQIGSIFSQNQATIGLGGYQNPFIPKILSQINSNMGYDQNPSIYVDNSDIVEAIRDLGDELMTLKDDISQMKVLMDGDALVGQIINRVDKKLGRIAEFKRRGM